MSIDSPKRKVLVADDEHIICDTLALILGANGFEPMCAYSGEAAVESARNHRPDVVVVDVILHGMSGLEAARQIRALYPGCRTILISGTIASSEMLNEAHALGGNLEFLTKPFAPDVLLNKLNA
jgi:CheY-like chemotaxis protein